MRNCLTNSRLANWLDFAIPDQELHYELVRALFSTPKSILGATIVAIAVATLSLALSGDATYGWFLLGFLIVGAGRSATLAIYQSTHHDPADRIATRRWEIVALLGAWSFASLVGLIGAHAVISRPAPEIEIFVSCCVMGYIAGISSRNASRPLISIGQIGLTCLPFTIALLLRADVVHLALASFIVVLFSSIIIICRAVFENIVARHRAFRKIEYIAHRDGLTGLWNRTAFIQLLEERLSKSAEIEHNVAVIYIDLDHFKDVNDTLGHMAGDEVLKQVANRIESVLGPNDQVARIGGDEFLVVSIGADETKSHEVAENILRTFSKPFAIGAKNNICSASIGYAIADDSVTLETLLRNADLALYEAKQDGRARIVRHTDDMTESYNNRVALERDLQFALPNGELELLYQPIVDPRSGRAICCEALLRWNHPRLGRVDPNVFIPIAEATGLIIPIGAWALATACAEAVRWPADISISVNLSPVQFRRDSGLVEMVLGTLSRLGLVPRRLMLEVTESVLIEDGVAVLAALEKLRTKDIGIALDDFGTGFASLSYLNDYPFTKVKLDRKFCQNVDLSARTSAIIGGVAKTARDLGIELVAEGVETENQLQHVRRFGINAIQGLLYCPAIPPDELRQKIIAPMMPGSSHAQDSRPRKLEIRKVAS